MRHQFPILVSRTLKTRKFKSLYFRSETCFGAGNLYKDLFSIYLQPSVNKNSWNLAFLTLQSDDVTVKTKAFLFRFFNKPATSVINNILLLTEFSDFKMAIIRW